MCEAVVGGRAESVAALLADPGTEVNAVDGAGQTALLVACSQGRDKLARIILTQSTQTVDVNKRCHQGFSPLLAASLAGFRFCVKALLGSRSLSLTATWEGMSAEQIAEANGHRRVVCLIRVSQAGKGQY